MLFDGIWHVHFLGYADDKPVQHLMSAVYSIECFVAWVVGALGEWIFVGCKVLVWRSEQAADSAVLLRLEHAEVCPGHVQFDTGLWLLWLVQLMHESIFVLAAVLTERLLQSEADLKQHILIQIETVVELTSQSSEKSAGPARERSKSLLLLPAVVVLLPGSFVQHGVAQLMLEFVAGCLQSID